MIKRWVERVEGFGPWPWRLAVIVAALAVSARAIQTWSDEMAPNSLVYLFIPELLAVLLMFVPRTKSWAQAILKGVAVVVLLFMPLSEHVYSFVFRGVWFGMPVLYVLGAVFIGLAENLKKKRENNPVSAVQGAGKTNAAQWWVISLTFAFTAGGILYHLLMRDGFGHTALMFLGIPAVLAIVLALTPKAKSATGGILKGITLALLIIAPLLGEGYLCILMASPLFYVCGIVVGVVVDERRSKRGIRLSCVALVLLPMSLEGVVPALSFNRTQTVEVSRVVNAPADAVEHRLALSPDITVPLPAPLRIGFPRPLAAWGEGLEIGALRTIHFSGAEGDPEGDLTMRATAREPGMVRFQAVSDKSKLTQWIAWDSSEVRWKQIDATHTEVTWRVQFERQLDPAWYFTPLERGAIHEAAKYLIEANATPHGNALQERVH